MRLTLPFAALLAFGLPAVVPHAAMAASAVQKECSTKYQAAKTANTLNGMTYNQFYKQCAADAKAEKAGGATPAAATPAPATPAATPAAPAPAPAAPTPTAAPAPMAPAPAPTTAAGGATFPTAIAPEFSKLKPHDARMKTCAQVWDKIKGTPAAGGMKWNPKGGGYYSACNTRLKG